MEDQKESISEVHDEGSCTKAVVLTNQKDENSTGIIEETSSAQHWRRQNLFLEIPSRTLEDSAEDCVRINMPPTPISTPSRAKLPPTPSPSSRTNSSPYFTSKGRSSFKSLLPKLSFKQRNPSLDAEKAYMLATGAPLPGPQEKTSVTRSLSLTKIFTPRMKRTSSLPVTPIAHSNPNSLHGGSMVDPSNVTKNVVKHHISRSLSVPVKARSIKRMDSLRGGFRVIPSTPRVTEGSSTTSNVSATVQSENNEADGEDIAEEEAVCRICFIELAEGGDTLKMECSCKGELALAHQECAVKWFSIKGNKNCDICKQEVLNLPVTLLRVQSVHIQNTHANRGQQTLAHRYRVWQDVPVLVIVSMLAYFCFLEQLLVAEMGTGAIAISLPFSCILGLLASMTSSTMVERKFVWVYALLQFVLVVLFAHIFYSLLHVQSILSILLSTFAGFGLAMSGSSILIEVIRWRRKWLAWSVRRRRSQGTPLEPDQQPEQEHPPERAQTDHHETETANPVTAQGS